MTGLMTRSWGAPIAHLLRARSVYRRSRRFVEKALLCLVVMRLVVGLGACWGFAGCPVLQFRPSTHKIKRVVREANPQGAELLRNLTNESVAQHYGEQASKQKAKLVALRMVLESPLDVVAGETQPLANEELTKCNKLYQNLASVGNEFLFLLSIRAIGSSRYR